MSNAVILLPAIFLVLNMLILGRALAMQYILTELLKKEDDRAFLLTTLLSLFSTIVIFIVVIMIEDVILILSSCILIGILSTLSIKSYSSIEKKVEDAIKELMERKNK